jgi:transcriptional regulator with XRE-family HTH domain
VVLFSAWSRPIRRNRCHHPWATRSAHCGKQKKLSLEQLAELTDSSKSYIWELENKDDPKPSAEKIGKIAAVLEVTTEFLLTESTATPGEEVIDEAFFRKYKSMPEPDQEEAPQDPRCLG